MATSISPALNRALKRGAVATTTVAQTGHVMRPLNASVEPQDTTELDRIFASLTQLPSQQEPSSPAGDGDLADAGAAGRGIKVLQSGEVAPAQMPSTARSRRRFAVAARENESDEGEALRGASHPAETQTQALQDQDQRQQAWDERISARLSQGKTSADADAPAASSSPAAAANADMPTPQRRRFQAQPAQADQTSSGDGSAANGAGLGAPASVSRPWSGLMRDEDRLDVVNVRKSMSAAKVLAPLVAAVSFRPGSSADAKDRSAGLSELLVSVHQNAVRTAEGLSAALKEDVPSWMVTQLMQSYASVVARRWERVGAVDPNSLGQVMAQVLGSGSAPVADLIRGASEDAYIEVNGPDIARYRIAVSVTNAAWGLFDWVTHERLSVDPSGNMPSEFFTYGLDASEIVNRLLVRCVDECRALVVQTDSADLRTAHMQSSIHRMSQLVGAEYVTQTRQIMDWIAEEGLSDQEFTARLGSASAELDTRILPHIFEWARVNFLRIEQGAFKAIEQLGEKARSARSPTEGGGRS